MANLCPKKKKVKRNFKKKIFRSRQQVHSVARSAKSRFRVRRRIPRKTKSQKNVPQKFDDYEKIYEQIKKLFFRVCKRFSDGKLPPIFFF